MMTLNGTRQSGIESRAFAAACNEQACLHRSMSTRYKPTRSQCLLVTSPHGLNVYSLQAHTVTIMVSTPCATTSRASKNRAAAATEADKKKKLAGRKVVVSLESEDTRPQVRGGPVSRAPITARLTCTNTNHSSAHLHVHQSQLGPLARAPTHYTLHRLPTKLSIHAKTVDTPRRASLPTPPETTYTTAPAYSATTTLFDDSIPIRLS